MVDDEHDSVFHVLSNTDTDPLVGGRCKQMHVEVIALFNSCQAECEVARVGFWLVDESRVGRIG